MEGTITKVEGGGHRAIELTIWVERPYCPDATDMPCGSTDDDYAMRQQEWAERKAAFDALHLGKIRFDYQAKPE